MSQVCRTPPESPPVSATGGSRRPPPFNGPARNRSEDEPERLPTRCPFCHLRLESAFDCTICGMSADEECVNTAAPAFPDHANHEKENAS